MGCLNKVVLLKPVENAKQHVLTVRQLFDGMA